jgi:Fe-S oxidoreductase
MDPRKFLRMAALGLDDEILKSDWVWMCSMCRRCIYVCPMKIDIPQLIYYARQSWPREKRPKGILGSCDMALRNDSCSAMGATPKDFQFVVKDARLEYGRLKDEQVKATGADYCITACHNCHAQIHELSEHYGGGYGGSHLWTLICLSLGILGPKERVYLRDDLKDVAVFHPETAM